MSNAGFPALVLATHNKGKIKEFSELLSPYFERFITADELSLPEPEETGEHFSENAILKARAAADASGLPALADDSGLAVTALGGAPGIYSARWAGADKDFQAAMARVNKELADSADRSAAFVCALALAFPGGQVLSFEGRCEGAIIWPPRGTGGFGYDPIFQPAGHDRSFGEMNADEKHALSHRAKAARQLAEYLKSRR